MTPIDHTHDPALRSWVEAANTDDCDFPLQNLPYGRFRLTDDAAARWRIGVAIGNQVLDLRAAQVIDHGDMAALLSLAPAARLELRRRVSAGLAEGSAEATRWREHLYPAAAVALGLPCDIRDFADFYTGIHHATAVGRVFRPDNPLLPNYKWVPIGYHGRASTIRASGHAFHRPVGQTKAPDAEVPTVGPTCRLDLELELGFVVGPPNEMGEAIPIEQAEDHVFGVTLFNDWSARDIQAWEYVPLGPFLAKSFASTISPWIVTLEALAPFRAPLVRPDSDPPPLPYLNALVNARAGALDIDVEALIQTAQMRRQGVPPHVLARSNAAQAAYWTVAQLVAHQTINGCALSPGDLLGSGTLSGPAPEQAGSLLELTHGGTRQIALPNGEMRLFLEDGDRVTLRGSCQRVGYRRVGFGECTATVLPPVAGP